MSIDLMNHPHFGRQFEQFKDEPSDAVTHRAIEHSLGNLVDSMELTGEVSIDHERRRIDVYVDRQDTILMALSQCPKDAVYDLHYLGKLVGKAVYRGITSEGGRVSVNTELEPEAPIDYITATFRLD